MGARPDASRAPARNRVTPSGLIVASPGRGAWMGNRGRLHDGAGSREIVRNHQTTAWITCRLQYRGRRAAQWHPRHYTPLFFLDEAVALAAGHRPCALCRRADYRTFRDAWVLPDPPVGPPTCSPRPPPSTFCAPATRSGSPRAPFTSPIATNRRENAPAAPDCERERALIPRRIRCYRPAWLLIHPRRLFASFSNRWRPVKPKPPSH